MKENETRYAVGLAIGQLGEGEPTALAVVRALAGDRMEVIHLERFEPGTSTRTYAARTSAVCSTPPLYRREVKFRENPGYPGSVVRYTVDHWPDVRIDATGASEAEVDAVRAALPGVSVVETVLTNGDAAGSGRMSRLDLAGLLRDYFEGGRLAWPAKLPHRRLLESELRRFRAKVPPGRTDADRAFRENEGDDCVLAVGMAVVAGREGGYLIGEDIARLFAGYRGI